MADVLFGDYNPAGRLPVTFYRAVDQIGDFNDYRMEGKTYRYFRGEHLYPFGHGLSFTTFEYTGLKVNRSKIGPKGTVEVSFRITNTGDRDGEEVVQLYVRDLESSLPMPVRQLRGFERIALKKGQGRQVRMVLHAAEDLSHYDVSKKAFVMEPGPFEIQIGTSSQDIRLTQVVTVR